jgi:hypothetical protein
MDHLSKLYIPSASVERVLINKQYFNDEEHFSLMNNILFKLKPSLLGNCYTYLILKLFFNS